MFLMWQDTKATPGQRLTAALAAYEARYGTPATLALVAAGEGAEVTGCEVRERKPGELVVGKGIVAVGRQ